MMKASTRSRELLNAFNRIGESPVSVSVYASMIIWVMDNKSRIISISFSESQCKLSHNQNFIEKKMKIVRKLRELLHS